MDDIRLAIVYQLTRHAVSKKAVIIVTGCPMGSPWPRITHPPPMNPVTAGVQPEVSVGLFKVVVGAIAVILRYMQPRKIVDAGDAFRQELRRDPDVLTADFTNGHIVKFEVGREVRVEIHGDHHPLGRPVNEVRAFLPSNLALAVQNIPVVRILAVRDPLLNRLIPDGALIVVFPIRGVLADRCPLQTIGRDEKAVSQVHEILARLVALIMIQRQRDVLAGVKLHDVCGFVLVKGDAFLAQRLFPMQRGGRLGVAQHPLVVHLFKIPDVPQLELPVIRIVQRRDNESPMAEVPLGGIAFPRQFHRIDNRLLWPIRFGKDALHPFKVIKDEIIEKQLLLRADVKEGDIVIRRYVGIPFVDRSLPRHDVLCLPLKIKRFRQTFPFGAICHQLLLPML